MRGLLPSCRETPMNRKVYNIVALEPLTEAVTTLIRVLEKSGQVELLRVPTEEEAYQVALQFQPCILLLSVIDAADAQLDLLKRLEKQIDSGQVKGLTVSAVKGHSKARLISDLCDYVEEPVPAKSLLFKVRILFKAIDALEKKNKPKREEVLMFGADAAPELTEAELGYKPALQLGEDIFVFKGRKPRLGPSGYVIEVEGPSPDSGQWFKEGEGWRWVPRFGEDGSETPDTGDGWVHEGKKPRYLPASGRWELNSARPSLSFRKNGKTVAAKVSMDEEGTLLLAEDTEAAAQNIIMSKIVAAQARERLVKESLAAQETDAGREEIKRLEKKRPQKNASIGKVDEEELLPEETLDDVDEEAVEKSLRRMALKKRGKKIPGAKASLESQEEEEAPWADKRQGSSGTAGGVRDKTASDEESVSPQEMQVTTREKQAQGLKREDLEGDQNLRDKMRDDADLKVKKEERKAKFQRRDLTALPESESPEARRALEKAERKRRRTSGVKAEGETAELEDEKQEVERKKLERESLEKLARKKLERLRKELAEAEATETELESGEEEAALAPEAEEAERRRLRHELGLADEGQTRAALKKLQRKDKARRTRDAIEQLEKSLGDQGIPLAALLAGEDAEEREREESQEKRPRNFRAIDSLDEDSGAFGTGKNKSGRENDEAERKKFYLHRDELDPPDGGWFESDSGWLYVPSQLFDSGFGKLDELLPAWFHAGEEEPVLEGDRWCFLDEEPEFLESAEELPAEMRRALKQLRDQAALALGIDPPPLPKKLRREKPALARPLGEVKGDHQDAQDDSGELEVEDGDPEDLGRVTAEAESDAEAKGKNGVKPEDGERGGVNEEGRSEEESEESVSSGDTKEPEEGEEAISGEPEAGLGELLHEPEVFASELLESAKNGKFALLEGVEFDLLDLRFLAQLAQQRRAGSAEGIKGVVSLLSAVVPGLSVDFAEDGDEWIDARGVVLAKLKIQPPGARALSRKEQFLLAFFRLGAAKKEARQAEAA